VKTHFQEMDVSPFIGKQVGATCSVGPIRQSCSQSLDMQKVRVAL